MSNAPVVGQRCTAFACSSGPRSHCRQPCSWRTTSSILPDLSFRQGQERSLLPQPLTTDIRGDSVTSATRMRFAVHTAVNHSISSPVIANSTTRRHPAMMPLLVSPTAKQGIRHQPIGSMMQVSWNRSSRFAFRHSSLTDFRHCGSQ